MLVRYVVLFLSALAGSGCLPAVTSHLGKPMHLSAGGPPSHLAVADLNGDGKIDLVITRANVETVPIGSMLGDSQPKNPNGSLGVMLGNGDGTFVESFNTVGLGFPAHPCVADFNGDGKADIAIPGLAGAGFVSILLGNGNGQFRAPVNVVVGLSASSVKAADFNGDGKLDLLVLDRQPDQQLLGGKLAVLLGHGDGTFDAANTRPLSGVPESIAVGDWNGDKRPDVAVAHRLGVVLLMGNGDGSFREGGALATGAALAAAGADINKDGRLDLLVARPDGTMVFLGNGDGTFTHANDYFTESTRSSYIADFDNDGNLDFVTARRLYLGSGTGSFAEYRMPESGYSDSFVVAADVNGDGWTDVIAADQSHGRIEVYLNQGAGRAPLRAAR